MKLEDLQHKLMTKQQERARLERLVAEDSIFDDQKVGLTVCNGAVPPAPPSPPAVNIRPPSPAPMTASLSPLPTITPAMAPPDP
ncbi:hypothetical protein DOY81_013268 [Sarcophaga bullata]|nr:hypothetical protein DOY81_013268 [Sarcophaga bullata]